MTTKKLLLSLGLLSSSLSFAGSISYDGKGRALLHGTIFHTNYESGVAEKRWNERTRGYNEEVEEYTSAPEPLRSSRKIYKTLHQEDRP